MSSYAVRIRRSLRGCSLKPSLRLDLFEEEFCLDLFGFLIALPFLDRWRYEPHEIMESWGVYYFERAVWLCWGRHSKAIHMPWDYTHIRTDVLRPDGTWTKQIQSYELNPGQEPDGRQQWVMPFSYTLKSGEVQNRTATFYAERLEWRWKCLRWCPLFAKVRTSIWIEFDGEVGERTGSWKGGTVGCGTDIKQGESPVDAYHRMCRERVFN